MAERPLGVIMPNGNGPQPATANMTAQTVVNPQFYMASSYRITPWPGNVGKIFIGDSTMEFATGTGVIAYINDPTTWDGVPYQSPVGTMEVSNPTDMATVFIDTEFVTDGALVTYVEA